MQEKKNLLAYPHITKKPTRWQYIDSHGHNFDHQTLTFIIEITKKNEYFIEVPQKNLTIFNHLVNNLSISLQWHRKNDLTFKSQSHPMYWNFGF
jgi:hypothetical protein